jgi:hypothetical protein
MGFKFGPMSSGLNIWVARPKGTTRLTIFIIFPVTKSRMPKGKEKKKHINIYALSQYVRAILEVGLGRNGRI